LNAIGIGLVAIVVGINVVSGVLFRRGKIRRLRILYRDPRVGSTYRNLPLVAPIAAVGITPGIVVAAVAAAGLDLHAALPHRVEGLVIFTVLGFLFGFVGLAMVASTRPPAWFVPRWLREEDEAIGYQPPPMDALDRVVRFFGYGAMLLGLVCAAYFGLLLVGIV
jgi:hypothetical protein